MYLTGILTARTETSSPTILTKSGTRDEVEMFILENMDTMFKCRTKNLETGFEDEELSITNKK